MRMKILERLPAMIEISTIGHISQHGKDTLTNARRTTDPKIMTLLAPHPTSLTNKVIDFSNLQYSRVAETSSTGAQSPGTQAAALDDDAEEAWSLENRYSVQA